MEQYNKLLKTMWRSLGANLNESSGQRMARSLESLELLIDSIDSDCSLPKSVGYRSKGKPEEAVKQIVSDLQEKEAFQYQPGREGYPSFPKFSASFLDGLNYKDLHKWMTGLLNKWESILE